MRDEPLGSQLIAGVETTGRRITIIVPAGYHGNTQPIEMIDERWESAELNLLIQSWHSDSRSRIEYRLSNIRRIEPPARLFEMPPDYTVDRTMNPGTRGCRSPRPKARAPVRFERDGRDERGSRLGHATPAFVSRSMALARIDNVKSPVFNDPD